MSDDHVFFEYRAKITNAGHAEDVGEPVHCFIKMKSGDTKGERRRNVDLEQQAGDNILFVLNPGPHRKINEVCLDCWIGEITNPLDAKGRSLRRHWRARQ